MYVRTYVCMYVCICVCGCVCVYVCACICVCVYTHIHIQIYLFVCIYIHTHIHAYMYVSKSVGVYVYTHTLTHIHTYIHTYIHTPDPKSRSPFFAPSHPKPLTPRTLARTQRERWWASEQRWWLGGDSMVAFAVRADRREALIVGAAAVCRRQMKTWAAAPPSSTIQRSPMTSNWRLREVEEARLWKEEKSNQAATAYGTETLA